MRVTLIRHPAPAIPPGVCYGRLDVAVDTSASKEMASTLAWDPRLRGARRVWTSPAIRCRGLADAIALSLALPSSVDHRLCELDFGAWEGRAWDSIPRADLDRWAASPLTFAPPGGETGAELIARMHDFHSELRRHRQDCVVVSHGGPLKILQALLRSKPIDLLTPAPAFGSATHLTGQDA
jgi:alpha-ribazole phosphatase